MHSDAQDLQWDTATSPESNQSGDHGDPQEM